jgi:molybdate transport system substrate-binding protein
MHHIWRILVLAVFAACAPLQARAEEIRALVTIGMQRVFQDVKTAFEVASGRKLDVQFASSPDIVKRVQDGEPADFVIGSRTAIDTLVRAGRVAPGNHVVLGRSLVAVAVPAGRPKPDISSAASLKNALLSAKVISFTDPASGGPSGVHFVKVLERLGIGDQVRSKITFPPFGGFVGDILARGEADIGFQQFTELSSFQGVDIVGPLPEEFQIITEYAAAIPANAPDPEAGKAVVAFMRSPQGVSAMKAKGLDPK